jgi:RNA polymerase-binding transcription factor DksA
MTITQSNSAVAPRTLPRHLSKSVKARLQAERALQSELLELPRPSLEPQAPRPPGRAKPSVVNIEMERNVVALLDAHARRAIADITVALARIESGTYGQCANCGSRIDIERLVALPRVELCIACQRISELR